MVYYPLVGEDRTPHVRRTTVAEAAEVLSISAEAVRGRIRRGTLPVEREGGTVYVLLSDQAGDRTTADQPRTTTDRPDDHTDLLIAELQDRVRFLEEANRENRRIIAALTQRIPELPAAAPQEPSESPAAARPQPGRVEPQAPLESPPGPRESPEMAVDEQQGRGPVPAAGGQQQGAERVPWWRRMFGG
jgi:hypothetical protein